jgi:hypothetical protein
MHQRQSMIQGFFLHAWPLWECLSPLSLEELYNETHSHTIQGPTHLSSLRMHSMHCSAFNCLPLKNKLCYPEINANLLVHREKAANSQISTHHNELKWSMNLSCSFVYNPWSLLEFTLHNYLREVREAQSCFWVLIRYVLLYPRK